MTTSSALICHRNVPVFSSKRNERISSVTGVPAYRRGNIRGGPVTIAPSKKTRRRKDTRLSGPTFYGHTQVTLSHFVCIFCVLSEKVDAPRAHSLLRFVRDLSSLWLRSIFPCGGGRPEGTLTPVLYPFLALPKGRPIDGGRPQRDRTIGGPFAIKGGFSRAPPKVLLLM